MSFSDDFQMKMQQMVVVLVNGAMQSVLDRDHGCIYFFVRESPKHMFKLLTRNYAYGFPQKTIDGHLAESTLLPLDRYPGRPHASSFASSCHRFASVAGTPSKSSTRSTLVSTISITLSGFW